MSEKMTNVEILNHLAILADEKGLYKKEAYLFVLVALEHTVKALPERRHLTGQELSYGIADFAREQYGYLAQEVLRQWGVTRTSDFGEMVYHMIENKLLTRTDTDSIEDFYDVFDFDNEFVWEKIKPGDLPERL